MGYYKGPRKGGESYSNCKNLPTDFQHCMVFSRNSRKIVFEHPGENCLFHLAVGIVVMRVLVMFSALHLFLT